MASRKYAVSGQSAVGTADTNAIGKTIITVIATAAVRPAIYDILWGSGDSPQDLAFRLSLQRVTATGTAGSSLTPQALDNLAGTAVAATASSGLGAFSVAPTYTANAILFQTASNSRSTQRWVCAPGFEFVAPAVANNGLGFTAYHASSSMNLSVCLLFEE